MINISEVTTKPSPAAISAGVRKSSRHATLEHELATARARRKELFEQTRALVQEARSANNDSPFRDALNALERERLQLQGAIQKLRVQLEPLRSEHARKVATAIRNAQRDDAVAALAALQSLSIRLGRLADGETEIAQCGGQAAPIFAPPLGELEARLRGIAGVDEQLTGLADAAE